VSKFIEEEPEGVHAFVQWKGTDLCMDFQCECGESMHFDGYFAYVVQCPHCLVEWEMPAFVVPRKRCEKTYDGHSAIMLEKDEDDQ
jgi:hypothetical protein